MAGVSFKKKYLAEMTYSFFMSGLIALLMSVPGYFLINIEGYWLLGLVFSIYNPIFFYWVFTAFKGENTVKNVNLAGIFSSISINIVGFLGAG